MKKSTARFAAVYFLASCIVMLLGSLLPSGNGPVVVFSKPWGLPAVEVVANANGAILSFTDSTWIAVTEVQNADFVSDLYRSGAGFVASSVVAYACLRLTGTNLEKTT